MEAKASVVVLITSGSKILLRRMGHEDYEILDIFGSFIHNGNAEKYAHAAVKNVCPKSTQLLHIGTITNFIHKPQQDVELTIWVYKAPLASEGLIKETDEFQWYEKVEVLNDERARRIHKFIERDLNNKTMDFILEENQFGRWIDAEVIRQQDK